MRSPIVFEVCAETLDACLAAKAGGADRIEICRNLKVGGLTPDHRMVERAGQLSGLPIHVLLRPHANGFCYSAAEFSLIADEIETMRQAGAYGVVLGVLLKDGRVDQERVGRLVRLAAPMEVTFHRAFDEVPNLDEALEDVIETGAHRLLTSGGAVDVLSGASALARLVQRAGPRIEIAAGGGLRLSNVAEVARVSGARSFHGSLQVEERALSSMADRVRAVMEILREVKPES